MPNITYLETIRCQQSHTLTTTPANNFEQHTIYNPKTGDGKNFLVSKTGQKVHIGPLEKDFQFRQWETIFMERSRKFDLSTIGKLAEKSGFKVVQKFTDKRNYFVDSLWTKV